MITHLLDTDVVIDVLRRRSPRQHARLAALEGRLAVSTITVAELSYGSARSSDPAADRAAVDQILSMVSIQPLDDGAARASGEIRAELAVRGTPIGPYDLLLAGQARSAGLVLATGNVREFKRVKGLQVENWR